MHPYNAENPLTGGSPVDTDNFYRVAATLAAASTAVFAVATLACALAECFVKAALACINGQ
jgi:hypothetical protein